MRRYRVLAASILVVVSNGLALLGVAWNRSAGPVQTMELTERELRLVSTSPDDSSVRLRLEWWYPGQLQNRTGTFNEAKLRELGFECPPPAPGTRRSETSRPAFIAFELDPSVDDKIPSETVRTIVTSSDGRPPAPSRVRSRLVVRDAALVYHQLRQRYPDTRRFLIARGVIRPYFLSLDPASDAAVNRWEGSLSQVIPREIYVPLPHSRALARLKSQPEAQRHYRVVLHYGRRLEPWVGTVEVKH
jgi:hypothetical protein